MLATGANVWKSSELFLTGAFFDHPNSHAAIVAEIRSTIEKMQASMAAGRIDLFVKYMAPKAATG